MPDSRGWAGIGLFSLAVFELLVYALVPGIRGDETFKNIMIATFTGGPLLVGSFFYSASKGASEANATIQAMVKKDGQ